MVTASRSVQRDSRPVGRSAGRRLAHRWGRTVRWARQSGVEPLLLVCALSVLVGLLQLLFSGVVPLSTLLIPMIIGNMLLGPRLLPAALVFILTVMAVVVVATPDLFDSRRIGGVVVIFVIGLMVLGLSFRRAALGVGGLRSESMLVDLRDRIYQQARMPQLPEDWYAEAVMRSAGGSSFAGDFMVGSRSLRENVLQVAVVDVSGKGEQAGARALLLAGAFGGLLGALPPERFLCAANDYLLRQDWSEGFATAVHVSIGLDDGRFEIRSAGHPPGAHLRARSGDWAVHQAEGPVLGLIPDVEFCAVRGTLGHGDALLLFTDGLVESSERDLSSGIARLLEQGDGLRDDGFDGSAGRLVDALGSLDDDRALLVLHRRPETRHED